MRASPWLACLLLLCSSTAFADDYVVVAKATTTQSKLQQLPSTMYDPSQAVDEFNKLQKSRDPSSFLFVAVQVPRQQLSLRKLAGRPVRFSAGDETYQGRVTSAFLPDSESEFVVIHTLIENRREAGEWRLEQGVSGVLSLLQ